MILKFIIIIVNRRIVSNRSDKSGLVQGRSLKWIIDILLAPLDRLSTYALHRGLS